MRSAARASRGAEGPEGRARGSDKLQGAGAGQLSAQPGLGAQAPAIPLAFITRQYLSLSPLLRGEGRGEGKGRAIPGAALAG